MIRIFFGSPGCGKTTSACRFIYKSKKNTNIITLILSKVYVRSKALRVSVCGVPLLILSIPLMKLG